MKWTALNVGMGDEGLGTLWRVESDGRTVDVQVPPGPGLLLRLEHAVAERLGVLLGLAPEPARYRIEESSDSHGDLYELERDTVWTVVDDVAGKPLWEFRGGTSHAFESGQWSASTGSHGVDEVVLSADGVHVLARDSDEVTCHPLADP